VKRNGVHQVILLSKCSTKAKKCHV